MKFDLPFTAIQDFYTGSGRKLSIYYPKKLARKRNSIHKDDNFNCTEYTILSQSATFLFSSSFIKIASLLTGEKYSKTQRCTCNQVDF